MHSKAFNLSDIALTLAYATGGSPWDLACVVSVHSFPHWMVRKKLGVLVAVTSVNKMKKSPKYSLKNDGSMHFVRAKHVYLG